MEEKHEIFGKPPQILTIIVIGGLVIWGLYVLSENNSSNDGAGSTLVSGNSQNNESQTKCSTSAEKAVELFKEKNSGDNFPEIDGTSDNKKDESATIGYKSNYDDSQGLCFVEYIVSMQATTVDTNEPIEGTSKIVTALVSDITKQQTLAGFTKTIYPTGSQKIACVVQKPGNYDDLNNKPIKELWDPTRCNSEAEFDSLVSERMGIR